MNERVRRLVRHVCNLEVMNGYQISHFNFELICIKVIAFQVAPKEYTTKEYKITGVF